MRRRSGRSPPRWRVAPPGPRPWAPREDASARRVWGSPPAAPAGERSVPPTTAAVATRRADARRLRRTLRSTGRRSRPHPHSRGLWPTRLRDSGDRRWLPTAGPTANLPLSAAPLASTDEPGRQPPQPARRSEADPVTRSPRVTLASRLGLGRVPSPDTTALLGQRAAHPHDGGESPGITPASPLLRTRLTPRSASVRLSPPGYSSPTRPGRSERPGHRGPPATRTRRARRRHLGTLGTLRGLPESSRWRSRRMPAEPPAGVSSTTTVPPTWTSPRLPRMCGESPPQTAFHGSLHVQACDFASVPFRLRVTPDALNISYRTSTAKAREGLPPPRQRNCQAYTHFSVSRATPRRE